MTDALPRRYDGAMFRRPLLPRLLTLIAIATLLAGCASSQPAPATFHVPAGQYADVFDAARDTLRAMRFELDRVDARAGVITTRPKHSAGFAAPWDREQSTLTQEWEDLANEQYRTVRILFERVDPADPTTAAQTTTDLRSFAGDLAGTVTIVIERKSRPLWHVDTTSVRLSSFARDPLGGGRRVLVPIARDQRLEGRLAQRLDRSTTKSP
jgi:hypothetical protein